MILSAPHAVYGETALRPPPRPALTQRHLPPVITATARTLPPFVPNGFARITRQELKRRSDGVDPVWGSARKPPAFAAALASAQSRPRDASHGNADSVFGSTADAEHIARSLEQLAALFRGRGLAALQRSLRDPVGYAVLRALADLPRSPASPRSAPSPEAPNGADSPPPRLYFPGIPRARSSGG